MGAWLLLSIIAVLVIADVFELSRRRPCSRCRSRLWKVPGHPCARCEFWDVMPRGDPMRLGRLTIGLAFAALATGVVLWLVVLTDDGHGKPSPCERVSGGLVVHEGTLRVGFSKRRWRDATPLRRGERRRLNLIQRCAPDSAIRKLMRKRRRSAKRRFHHRFREMIAPPGRAYLERVGGCESGTSGGYRAVSPDGAYRGKYQFDSRTWGSVGGHGDPAAAPPREQDFRAAKLYRARGSQPWPVCG